MDLHYPEATLWYEFERLAREVVIGEANAQRINEMLHGGDGPVRTANMFDEDKTTTGSKNPVSFGKCLTVIGNCAKAENRDNDIYGFVTERQRLGIGPDEENG